MQAVLAKFKKIAAAVGAAWSVSDTFCTLKKNGVSVRVNWVVESVAGLFVTVSVEGRRGEYGLCYLVEFWNGDSVDIAKNYTDELGATAEVTEKYLPMIYERLPNEFAEFEAFTLRRIKENRKNLPAVPLIEDNEIVRRGWLEPLDD